MDPTALPEHLWQVPAYLPYLQPPLTDAMVAEAEARLGVRLPRAYLAALRIQNGGYLRRQSHSAVGGPVDYLAGIGPRFPSILDHDWSEIRDHMREEGITTPERIDELIAFSGDGHTHVCFDYRRTGRASEPTISYIDLECFNVDTTVAPDFETFVLSLRDDPRDQVGLVTGMDVHEAAEIIGSDLDHDFEDQGDQDHGYPVFRAPLGDDDGPKAWMWVSPNFVPRGFVRESEAEPGLERLVGSAYRFPEHEDCDVIVEVSGPPELVQSVLAALPFPSRVLSRREG